VKLFLNSRFDGLRVSLVSEPFVLLRVRRCFVGADLQATVRRSAEHGDFEVQDDLQQVPSQVQAFCLEGCWIKVPRAIGNDQQRCLKLFFIVSSFCS
jgi:hypothetical protein